MSGRRTQRLDADREARRLAQSRFDTPVVIEAGAGTGKTTLLVSRVVAWCVGPGWQRHAGDHEPRVVARKVVERVVAITFTEAAAADMARKIGRALLELAGGKLPDGWGPDPEIVTDDVDVLSHRAAMVLDEVHRLPVSTIHAFCQRLLSTYPLEGGFHPRFVIDAEGLDLEALAEDVVERALRRLEDGEAAADWEFLAERRVGPADVANALVGLVTSGVSAADLAADPFDAKAAISVAARLMEAARDFLAGEGGKLGAVRGPVSIATRDAVYRLSTALDDLSETPSFADLAGIARAVGEKAIARLGDWGRVKLTGSEGDCLGDSRWQVAAASDDLATLLVPLMNPPVAELEAARRILAPLLQQVQERREELGVVTFRDLLVGARRVLERAPDVCRGVRREMDQLLVDEFQDTDQVQCDIVRMIALEGRPEDRPGLFIVGDPKQSIYAWRNADLAAYHDFVEKVAESGGQRGCLIQNFRSVPAVLDEVTRVVGEVMHEQKSVQPPFEELEACDRLVSSSGFDTPPWRPVEHLVAWPRNSVDGPPALAGARQVTELEAEAVAKDIADLHDEGGVKWGKIGVLLRATTQQEVLLDAFRRLGIPYEVARERDYYRQREVVEAAALVRSVLEPADTLALLTVIRSDVVGVPDAALAPLWEAGFPGLVASLSGPDPARLARVEACIEKARQATPEAPGVELVPAWPEALRAAAWSLAVLRRSYEHDPPDVFTEQLRALWLADVTAAARRLGRFRVTRLDRFFAELETRMGQAGGGGARLARFLRRAVEEARESRLPGEPDLEANAVHVMTIHGAKGLEFEHVYVVQNHKRTRGGRSAAMAEARFDRGTLEYALFSWTTPGFAIWSRQRERQAQAELIRLLYVALTRAERRLVISGGYGDPSKTVEPSRARSFGQLLLARRGGTGPLEDMIAQLKPREQEAATGVGWVLPALEDLPGMPVRVDGVDRTGYDVSVAKTDSAVIMQDRIRAAHRMGMRYSAAASSEAKARVERAEVGADDQALAWPSDRGMAMAIGTLVHEALETLDLHTDPRAQLRLRRAAMEERLERVGERRGSVEEARRRLSEILERVEDGSCMDSLRRIGPRLVARELPLLLPADRIPDVVGSVAGTADLIYRDNGRLVVADYKTDVLSDDDDITARSERYRPQLELYARALRDALDLDDLPAMELWFLWPDRIVRL